MYPTNCVMCTIGHFLGSNSYGAANATNAMDGPHYNAAEITAFLVKGGFCSSSDYVVLDDLEAATRHMTANPGDYVFGYIAGAMGHVIAATSSGGMIEYTDEQVGSTTAPDAGYTYHLWRIDAAMGSITTGMKLMSLN